MPKAKKVTFRSSTNFKDRSGVLPPPIDFSPTLWSKKDDDEGVMSFKLRSNPSDRHSPQYELQAKIFATGSTEQFILWKRDVYKIIKGQNITQPQDKFTMVRRLLSGDALSVFDTFAETRNEALETDFTATMHALAMHIFPRNALANQKSWLRRSRQARKTNELKTRRWVARIQEINMMLPEFPPEYSEEQKLRSEDLIEILEYGIPNTWKAKMVELGFIPADHTPIEFIECCEKFESAEQMLGLTHNPKSEKAQEKQGSKPNVGQNGTETNSDSSKTSAKASKGRGNALKRCKSYAESEGKDGCAYHVNTTTHRSNECKVLMAQAKSMRGQHAAAFKGNNNKNNNNKSKAGDFHALLAQAKDVMQKLAKSTKSHQAKSNKKRKRDDSDSESESDKNFDPDSFHLDLEETSLNNSESDTNEVDLDWGDDNVSVE
jgi:hypothetical protein